VTADESDQTPSRENGKATDPPADALPAHAASANELKSIPAGIRDAGPNAVESYLRFLIGFEYPTRYILRAAGKHFFQWAEKAGIPIGALQPGDINAFFDNADWQFATKRTYFSYLKRLFVHLESDQIIERSPFADASAPKKPTRRSLEGLKQFLKELDGYTEESEYYRPGLVAMYPIIIGGMDTNEIANSTGIPVEEVETYANRLRENRIWLANGKIAVDFEDPEKEADEAVLNMVLIIGCAAGEFQRPPGEAGLGEHRETEVSAAPDEDQPSA
jgi:hypothetical protein